MSQKQSASPEVAEALKRIGEIPGFASVRALLLKGLILEALKLLKDFARRPGPLKARALAILNLLGGTRKARGPSIPKRRSKKGGGAGESFSVLLDASDTEIVEVRDRYPVSRDDPVVERGPVGLRIKRLPKPVPPKPIRRTPHIDLPPGALVPGQKFTATVYVDTKKARADEKTKDVEIEAREGQDIYKVDVWMAGSHHFVIDNPKTGTLILDRRKDKSEPVPFQVRVPDTIDDPRGAVLFAYFSYEGRPSGQISKQVKLSVKKAKLGVAPPRSRPAETPPKPPAGGFRIAPGLPRADITIEVTDPERTLQRLVCRVTSPLLKPEEQPAPEDWFLSDKSGDLVAEFMQQFVDDQNHRAYSLIGAGSMLYKAAPKSFKEVLWKLIDRRTPPRTILITSDEPFIPWELMIPSRPGPGGEQRKALGVEFRVGRWTRDDHQSPPVDVPLKRSCVVAPIYSGKPALLKHSTAEVALVLLAVPGKQVNPAVLTGITAQLDAEAPSLLHFVCHGVAGAGKGVQAIYLHLGKERLTSLEVTAIPSIKKALKQRPLVFLNACEVGRPAVALTGIGGFAAAFLELGAAAVIAPLWSVKDDVAHEVAKLFYQAATGATGGGQRKSFAAIMQQVRGLAYDPVTGEDTYAAYCFYGDPNATAS